MQRFRWIWPVVLAAVIFFASGQSQIAGPDIVNFDKFAHFCVYGLLATFVYRAGFTPRRAWLAVLITSLYGISDEWHQSFTPGRSVSVYDWTADTLGAILAVTLYVKWAWYHRLLDGSVKPKRRVEKITASAPDSTP